MELAALVARDATTLAPEHLDRLRALGLTDREILDFILAAAARCFFSKTLDAVGALADPQLAASLAPPLRDALTVGRPPGTA
ncbi:MAG TPA: carboxymuconolactone decarboxylase family protein [Solirubrobacteraceae bacterium]|nr:carboxymuconolactone decarboxylase family protein [Solirubrobacteraceae bacterium]